MRILIFHILFSLFCRDSPECVINTILNIIDSPVLRGRPSSKRSIHICGRPRWLFVLLFSAGVHHSKLSSYYLISHTIVLKT